MLQLRPQFPALARLPRFWNLLYSLDQHGISLNTLYTRCDSHVASTLVVIRDAEDAVFGAWMGEGVHPHRNGYYGSGESCVAFQIHARFPQVFFGGKVAFWKVSNKNANLLEFYKQVPVETVARWAIARVQVDGEERLHRALRV